MTIAHWDEVEPYRSRRPGMGGAWSDLATAAGSRAVGLNRIRLEPGEVSTPAHVHGAEEEIFYVLAGSGLSWQDGETYEVGPGDCLVHPIRRKAHTLRAGGDGLDVLAFGPRIRIGGAYLPKAGAYWLWPTWTEAGQEPHPFDRGHGLEWPQPSPRPAAIVNAADVAGDYGGGWKRLGHAAGATLTGLNLGVLAPGEQGAPPHCHSVEEELFVVLDGEGVLELWAPPRVGDPHQTEPQETHALGCGHVVSRPPGTRIAHSLRAGEAGLAYLAYGTRDPGDVCYYPRSNKVFLRGVGLIARLEPLAYSDGEPG